MPLDAGSLDRKITIQRKSLAMSDSGEPVETWRNIADRWSASMKPFRASEGFMIPEKTAYEQVEFRIRYSSAFVNLSPLDRIIYPALTAAQSADPSYEIPGRSIYDILGVLELDRRVGFRIITNRRPDSGGAEISTGSKTMSVDSGTYVFSGSDVLMLGANKFLVGGIGAYNFTGTAAALVTGKSVAAGAGAYNFTGTDANTFANKAVAAGVGAYTFTGTDVTLLKGKFLDATTAGAYNFTGTAVNFLYGRAVAAGAGAYNFTGSDAALLTAANKILLAGAGAYTFTGTAASTLANKVMAAGVGAYNFTGTDAALNVGKVVAAGAGSYGFTGTDVTLTPSGAAAGFRARYYYDMPAGYRTG